MKMKRWGAFLHNCTSFSQRLCVLMNRQHWSLNGHRCPEPFLLTSFSSTEDAASSPGVEHSHIWSIFSALPLLGTQVLPYVSGRPVSDMAP